MISREYGAIKLVATQLFDLHNVHVYMALGAYIQSCSIFVFAYRYAEPTTSILGFVVLSHDKLMNGDQDQFTFA